MNKVISQMVKTSTFGADELLAQAIYGGLAWVANSWRQLVHRHKARRELERLYLDEHLLKDVGLTRFDLAGYGPSEAELASHKIMRKTGM